MADKLGDPSLLHKPVELPHALQLVHALAVADFHILVDAAVDAQSEIVLVAWHNEADVVNASKPDTSKHFRLRTKFDNKITCLPDAGFLLNHDGQRTAYYLELERGGGDRGTGARQLAERKCPGYAEMARQQTYRLHFPGVEEFRVLLVVPHARRRDAVREAFQKKDATEFRTDLWRFVAHSDISAETLFHAEICYRCGPEPPERLTPAAGVRSAPAQPDTPDGTPSPESSDAGVAAVGPAALLAGPEPAAEPTPEVGPSMTVIPTSKDADALD